MMMMMMIMIMDYFDYQSNCFFALHYRCPVINAQVLHLQLFLICLDPFCYFSQLHIYKFIFYLIFISLANEIGSCIGN